MKKQRVLTIIPARGGSKRVPGKNKKKLAGKELIRYAIEASLHSKETDTIVVSSDDEDILSIGREYPSVICLRRPEEISGDKALAITYVHHALEQLSESFDLVVIVQPTSPFTLGSDIDSTIRLLDNKRADSSVSVMQLDHAIHPLKLKIKKDNELFPYLEEEKGRMAAHELSELYARNGSVYVSRITNIHEGKIIGDVCLGYEMPRERSLDINDKLDFEFAEYLINKSKSKD
ncbi:MAG: acylneuraminate cytidylyltransferase family protein [Bacteroidota bacterium]